MIGGIDVVEGSGEGEGEGEAARDLLRRRLGVAWTAAE